MKDWKGNSRSAILQKGGHNFTEEAREQHDYYATDPRSLQDLLDRETFSHNVWECACGEGHLSKCLTENGYDVRSTDIVDRGFEGQSEVLDFLKCDTPFDGDIITNPPYAFGKEFVYKSMELVAESHKVAMFLNINFLETQARKELFEKYPPKVVYVFSKRQHCGKNGDFDAMKHGNAIAYCWIVWEKGHHGDTVLKWI